MTSLSASTCLDLYLYLQTSIFFFCHCLILNLDLHLTPNSISISIFISLQIPSQYPSSSHYKLHLNIHIHLSTNSISIIIFISIFTSTFVYTFIFISYTQASAASYYSPPAMSTIASTLTSTGMVEHLTLTLPLHSVTISNSASNSCNSPHSPSDLFRCRQSSFSNKVFPKLSAEMVCVFGSPLPKG
jgi:hypothetical protein